MTDVYPNEIVNSQRNSNTSLQGSTLQSSKGPLNTMFNLQSLRTVKGRVNLPLYTGLTTGLFCVLNEYDNSPIQLYNGDIVLSVVLSNGNPTYSGIEDVPTALQSSYTTNSKRLYPINYQNGSNVTFCVGQSPTYNYPNWTPNPNNLYQLTNTFNLYTLIAGTTIGQSWTQIPNVKCQSGTTTLVNNNTIGSLSNTNNTCYSGSSPWLYCLASNILIYSNTQLYPSINVTLIILNPIISQ
jgi:hypothetical protein